MYERVALFPEAMPWANASRLGERGDGMLFINGSKIFGLVECGSFSQGNDLGEVFTYSAHQCLCSVG